MLGPEREQQRILGRGRLQLEIELTAESLTERESPRTVDPAAERCMKDELHPTGFVEEALEDQRVLGRDDAQRASAFGHVADHLFGPGCGQPGFRGEPVDDAPFVAIGSRVRRAERAIEIGTQIADGSRQLVAARWRLAQPERNRRRRTRRVGDAHVTAGHLEHAPGRVPELKHIARVRLDGEVFVQRPDERLAGIEHHTIIGNVRNGAARGEREQARATASTQRPMTSSRWTSAARRPRRVAKPSETIATTASKSSRVRSR